MAGKFVKCKSCDIEMEVSKFAYDTGHMCAKCKVAQTDDETETNTEPPEQKIDEEAKEECDLVDDQSESTKTRPPYPSLIKNPYCPSCDSGKIKYTTKLVTGGGYWVCLDCGHRFKTDAEGEIIW